MPSVRPFSVQVAGLPTTVFSVWPVAGIFSVLVSWQTVQVKVLTPSFKQVGVVVISPSPHL